MKPYKHRRVLARFSPKTTADLDPELARLIGTVAEFRYHRYLDDDDTPYSGQWVLTTGDQRFGGYWFPESDLEILSEEDSA